LKGLQEERREGVRQGRGRGLSGLSDRPSSSLSREKTVGKGVHAALSFVMCSVMLIVLSLGGPL